MHPGDLPSEPKILFQRKYLIEIHNSGEFLEDILCSSHFTDSQKLYLQNICKTYILTKIGRTQNLHFWSNFDPSSPPKDGQNRKK